MTDRNLTKFYQQFIISVSINKIVDGWRKTHIIAYAPRRM